MNTTTNELNVTRKNTDSKTKDLEIYNAVTGYIDKLKLNKEEVNYLKKLKSTHGVYLNGQQIEIYGILDYIDGFRESTKRKLESYGYIPERDSINGSLYYKKVLDSEQLNRIERNIRICKSLDEYRNKSKNNKKVYNDTKK